MSSIMKGMTSEGPITKTNTEPEVRVPGYGTMPLDMLKRHVRSLSNDFNDSIQKGEFLKATYRTEQFYNALMALAKALKQQENLDETISTGTTAGSAGIGGGSGIGVEASPIVKAFQNQVDEGEVVSMQARRTPLVVAGSPFSWNVYDLRNNKMVASIIGGDRRESPLYEIRINSNGMTPSTRMLPTYVLTAGPDSNPPYNAYELVPPEGGFSKKIEKSPGPGGTTKLHPDADDQLRHLFKNLGGGKYYGYDLYRVEEGLDQWDLVEKALGAKIMDTDDAMELDYTDWDPEDSSSIVYLGNKNPKPVDEAVRPFKAAFNAKPKQVGPGYDKEDYKYTEFVPNMKSKDARQDWAIDRDVKKANAKIKKPKSSSQDTGFYKNYLGNRPVREEDIDEHINSPGGMGQSYRKFRPIAPAGADVEENLLNTYGDQLGLPKESAVMKGIIETGVTRWSKENPPPPDLLLNTLIQILMNPQNEKSPDDLINLWNEKYGLKHTLRTLRQYAQNDYKKAELSKALMKAVGIHESSKRK